MRRPSHLRVRCPCGADHLMPNTLTWRAAIWISKEPGLLWSVPLFVIVLLLVGKGLVVYASR